jgi:DNA helicase-2/ATP-dependent DNA helicase PcrA
VSVKTEYLDKLLVDLTEPQRQAVTHIDGPLLIIAAAGSGKTRVITRRVAYLMGQEISPTSILGITFTNKAAGEMKARVSAITPRPIRDWGRLDQPWPIICTFHSLCLRILKHYAPMIGLAPNFSIYDSADQTKLIKEAIKALDLSTTNFPAGTVHATISNAKNQLIDAAGFAASANDFYARTVSRIFTKYQQYLDANNALDFDDLILRAVKAMQKHPRMLAELQDRFRYILIDEYQDTNRAQYMLSNALAMKHRNICVVGDPDQSIYAWRGADISNILDFEKDYPDATVVRLEQNYRSTKTILAIAEQLIAKNLQRKDKRLWTENPQGEKVTVLLCQNEHDEAKRITEELQRLSTKEKIPWNQMAIFYRMNALSRVMEDALRQAGVPYQIARGVEFYNRKEIKDVLAYLRAVANPNDEVSLTRIINVPARALGPSSVKLMEAYGVSHGLTLWETLRVAHQIEGISTRASAAARQFIELIESFRAQAAGQSDTGDIFAIGNKHAGLVQSIMEAVVRKSGLEGFYKKEDPDEEEQVANINELISSAAEYDKENPEGSLDDYLARVSLVSDADHLKGGDGAVTMMTLHAAKGLEFPVVAMIGLEEGCLPHSRAQNSPQELEEERRLCFVGITRAQQRLILSEAAFRTIRGLRERTTASRFLGEIPTEHLHVTDHTGIPDDADRRGYGRTYDGARLGSQLQQEKETDRFQIGQKVRHQSFGIGKIAEITHMGQHTRAVVQFNTAGRKTLILEYARLQPL